MFIIKLNAFLNTVHIILTRVFYEEINISSILFPNIRL